MLDLPLIYPKEPLYNNNKSKKLQRNRHTTELPKGGTMQIPNDTPFLFVCKQHVIRLEGTAALQHPSPVATAVWTFDMTAMWCPQGTNRGNNCQATWEARA